MKMMSHNAKAFLSFCFLVVALNSSAQTIDDYFQKIRKNEAELTAFISQMPKGGDLHNHYTGSVYAESYVNWMIEADCCINLQTLQTKRSSWTCDTGFVKFSYLQSTMDPADFELLRSKIIRSYSTKEYDQVHTDAREEHFFATFSKFGTASGMNFDRGLKELKNRAIAENVSYIEMMFSNIRLQKHSKSVPVLDNADTMKYYNSILWSSQKINDRNALMSTLQKLHSAVKNELPFVAPYYNGFVDSLHKNFVGENPNFTLRYLAFIPRIFDPLPTFLNLLAAFETVHNSASKNLIGVNIVAPEDNPVSMRDYWLHMQFFAYCHSVYPDVHYTMHAGELTEGVVQPEELTWHINGAVRDAGANRIGHGVDIAYEKNNYDLLRYMSTNKIAIEINLLSNEFILGVKDDKHPVLLYKHFNVPIVISTDDPGVSRSSLTEQYVLLARRYDEVSYQDIKTYVYNSIRYSFIADAQKERLIKDISQRFEIFEKEIMSKKP